MLKNYKLKTEMVMHDDTLKSLSKVVGITVSTLSRRIRGELKWKDREIEKICKYYGKTKEELF